MPADLPLIDVDALLIERVLMNLLDNAAKYAGTDAAVAVRARVFGETLYVFVEDDGPGFIARNTEPLFEPFERERKESSISGVAARAVPQHRQRARRLDPRGAARSARRAVRDRLPRARRPISNTRAGHDQIARTYRRGRIGHSPFRADGAGTGRADTCEASTAREARMYASSSKPDLVIVDLGLPDDDGKTFIRELREWSTVPVIVLSARQQEVEKVAALDAGADDYLPKPFGVPELLARARAQLRRGVRLGRRAIVVDRAVRRRDRRSRQA